MPPWKGIVDQGFTPDDFETYVQSLSFTSWRSSSVVLHNTGLPTFTQWHTTPGAQRMLNLQTYHRDTQHWSAGPHLFVADDLIWAFTPLTVPGVHSPSWNNVSWGVEMVGDYSVETMNPALKGNAMSALATLHIALGISPTTMKLHREDLFTTHICPGANVSKQDFITQVTTAVQNLNPGDHLQDASAGY